MKRLQINLDTPPFASCDGYARVVAMQEYVNNALAEFENLPPLKKFRVRHGLTQIAVAKALGISQPQLCRRESDYSDLTIGEVTKLLSLIGREKEASELIAAVKAALQ